MSDFDTYELSSRQSAPIHLYKFTRNSDEWFYCSGTQEDFIFDGDTYTPAVINHSRIGTTQNPYDDTLHIECNTGLEIITDNIGEFQRDKIYLTLIRIQNYNASYYENIWFGYISNMIYVKNHRKYVDIKL